MEWVEGEGGRRWLELGGVKVGIRQRKRPLARDSRCPEFKALYVLQSS